MPNNILRQKGVKSKTISIPFILEIEDLCNMLSVGKNTAYNLITSGEIDAFKVGSVWKIPLTAIESYIDRKCKEARLVPLYRLINPDSDIKFETNGYRLNF